MRLVGVDKNHIKNYSKYSDGFYVYSLGNNIEVTCRKSKHFNSVIANNLSSEIIDDKFMIRYRPINEIMFSEALIDSDTDLKSVSLYIDKNTFRLYIGTEDEFSIKSGVLSFSGLLSMNNLVEKDIPVMCNARLKNTIMKRVRVLAVGVKNSSLFALYYVPSVRGMALGLFSNSTVGISMSSFKEKDCTSYNSFTIKDWFGDAKIVELER